MELVINIFNLKSKIIFVFFYDFFIFSFVWILSFALRFNFEVPPEQHIIIFYSSIIFVPIQFITNIFFKVHKSPWRITSIDVLKKIVSSIFLGNFISLVLFFMIFTEFRIPRSVLIINTLLSFMLILGGRVFVRILYDYLTYGKFQKQGERVLLICSSNSISQILKELNNSKSWNVMAILSDDPSFHEKIIHGIKVFAGINQINFILKNLSVNKAIINLSDLKYQERRFVLRELDAFNISSLSIPSINDLINHHNLNQMRPVNLEDLLRREEVILDFQDIKSMIENKVIFVSGAGGSIGSEISRQILKFSPRVLVCLDISEFFLYELEQELSKVPTKTKIVFKVADIGKIKTMFNIFSKFSPSLIFHAAAFKHVPLMENENVAEAFNNNVIGTFNFAKLSKRFNVKKFVLISTDKAINPTNIMGSTKRLAEMICQSFNDKKTNFISVRFGNVLGSNGSVIPKFYKQIKEGGPVTITHKEITRYFMLIPEASKLVLQAAHMGIGGEVFILDMGSPIKIVDLAKDMINLSGFDLTKIKIKFTGLRPGEKLYEELFLESEEIFATQHDKIRVSRVHKPSKEWVNGLLAWIKSIQNKDERLIKQELTNWLKEYRPYL